MRSREVSIYSMNFLLKCWLCRIRWMLHLINFHGVKIMALLVLCHIMLLLFICLDQQACDYRLQANQDKNFLPLSHSADVDALCLSRLVGVMIITFDNFHRGPRDHILLK